MCTNHFSFAIIILDIIIFVKGKRKIYVFDREEELWQ